MLSDHHSEQQKQPAGAAHTFPDPDHHQTNPPEPDRATWEPHQIALSAALQRHNAGAVADQIVQCRPELTPADLHTDLAAAEAHPSVRSPLGLVCAAWLAGSRVTAPRSLAAWQPVGDAPQEPESPSDTEQYLLAQGFSARAAHEFQHLAREAVQEACAQAFSSLDTSHERNQKIGTLVVRWRRHPPGGAPAAYTHEPEADAAPPAADQEPQPTIPVDTSSLDSVWQAVLGSLQMMLPQHDYAAFLRTTRLLELREQQATIGCAHPDTNLASTAQERVW
jgi:hypothetical protein